MVLDLRLFLQIVDDVFRVKLAFEHITLFHYNHSPFYKFAII